MDSYGLQLVRDQPSANQHGVVVFVIQLVLDQLAQLAKLQELFHSHQFELLLQLNQLRPLSLGAKLVCALTKVPLKYQLCNQVKPKSFPHLLHRKYVQQLGLEDLDQMKSRLDLVLVQLQKCLRNLLPRVRSIAEQSVLKKLVATCDQHRAQGDGKLQKKVCDDDSSLQLQLD